MIYAVEKCRSWRTTGSTFQIGSGCYEGVRERFYKRRTKTYASCLDSSGSHGTLKRRAMFRRHALISEAEGAENARARITVGDIRLPVTEDRKSGPR